MSVRINELTALGAAPATGDLLLLTDVSDTTDSAQGTDKKITAQNLLSAVAASAFTGQVALSAGGTGAKLSDPGADRVLFWDDSASAITWLTVGTGLSITDTSLTATGGGGGGSPAGTGTEIQYRVDGTTFGAIAGSSFASSTLFLPNVHATAVSGADQAGTSLVVAGGARTGNATPGTIIFKTSAVGSTGSTVQTQVTRMILTGSLLEITTDVTDTTTNSSNLKFSYSVAPTACNNTIENIQSGTAAAHKMIFKQTQNSVTTTALTLSADGFAKFDYIPVFTTNISVKGGTAAPGGIIETVEAGVSAVVHLAMSYTVSASTYSNQLRCSFDSGTDALNILHLVVNTAAAATRNDVMRLRGNQVAEVVKNLGIKSTAFGTSSDGVVSIGNGTEPGSSPADSAQMYSKDVTAGNACMHFREEGGAVIKLKQQAKASYNNWAAFTDVVAALVAMGIFDTA